METFSTIAPIANKPSHTAIVTTIINTHMLQQYKRGEPSQVPDVEGSPLFIVSRSKALHYMQQIKAELLLQ
jgi:hypothetical protein